MSSINKIKISSTTYDVSPSPDGTLSGYTSSDTSQSTAGTSYTSVEPISSSDDTNSTIFTKTTKMVKNIRVLYNKIGTTDISSIGSTITGAINSLNTSIAGKAAASHSHGVSDLPVSNQQSSSETLIPTAGLVNSMNTTLSGISAKYTMESSFTTNITCGGISSGTSITSSDTLRSTIKNLLYQAGPLPPSTEYEDKSLGTWSTAAQVNTFFTEHTYYNGWSGLKIGNYVTISDGTYNKQWVIAGFNCETATDGTPGGIVFIPRYVGLTTNAWHSNYTSATPYNSSSIHTLINGTIKTNLSTILGNHIVERNVTLGSACSGTSPRNWTTSATTNTTAYLTLMSWGQLSGTFGNKNNSYDDGEANYKLPLMNFIDLSTYTNGSAFWLRNVYGKYSIGIGAWFVVSDGSAASYYLAGHPDGGVRPLMHLR